jgi:hypothetical protein
MESVIDALKRRLREAGSARWFLIASEAGVAKTLPRKLVYGDRCNPGVLTIQPLISYFAEIDEGIRSLPDAAHGECEDRAAVASAVIEHVRSHA